MFEVDLHGFLVVLEISVAADFEVEFLEGDVSVVDLVECQVFFEFEVMFLFCEEGTGLCVLLHIGHIQLILYIQLTRCTTSTYIYLLHHINTHVMLLLGLYISGIISFTSCRWS